MATTEKIINSRIQLKYDTLANWQTVEDTFVPKSGEIIIYSVPADAGVVTNEPAVLFKVGDGTSTLGALSFTSAIAADVAAWAKAATKPEYTANEIKGLEDFIDKTIEDSNTIYKLEQDTTDTHKIILSKQEIGETTWDVVAEITMPDNDTTYTAADGSVEVDDTAHTIGVNVSAEADNAISKKDDGLYAKEHVVNVVKKATANDGYIASYQVTVDGTVVGADIDIPKDYLVKSAEVKVVETADEPYTGAEVGDKYIDFVVNTVGGDGNESHIYLAVKDFAKEYSAGNGIEISATNVISLKLGTNTNGLSVGANGLELAEATATTAGAMSAADKAKVDSLGDLAEKDKVGKDDLEDDLKTELEGKADDADLADVAKSGKAEDVDFDGVVLVLNCGSATVNV